MTLETTYPLIKGILCFKPLSFHIEVCSTLWFGNCMNFPEKRKMNAYAMHGNPFTFSLKLYHLSLFPFKFLKLFTPTIKSIYSKHRILAIFILHIPLENLFDGRQSKLNNFYHEISTLWKSGFSLIESTFILSNYRYNINYPSNGSIHPHRVYRKIPNVSPGLIEVFQHFIGGLYSGGLIFGGGLYSEGILC